MRFFRKLFGARRRRVATLSSFSTRSVSERIAEEFALLQQLEFERIVRGDPSYGREEEDEIVWRELVDLEVHQIGRGPLM